jgi:hypothetical protein
MGFEIWRLFRFEMRGLELESGLNWGLEGNLRNGKFFLEILLNSKILGLIRHFIIRKSLIYIELLYLYRILSRTTILVSCCDDSWLRLIHIRYRVWRSPESNLPSWRGFCFIGFFLILSIITFRLDSVIFRRAHHLLLHLLVHLLSLQASTRKIVCIEVNVIVMIHHFEGRKWFVISKRQTL